jgi:heme-degrading monooxygenase HmoA
VFARRTITAGIAKDGIYTQITAVKLPDENQQAVVELMIERARFMATQPGFVSVNLHLSRDGTHLINYAQWTTLEKLEAAHHSPGFRRKWPQFGKLADAIEPGICEVAYSNAA